jgi:hypothetical protein
VAARPEEAHVFTTDMSVAAMQVGCLGLLWAAAYTALARHTPIDLVPSVLHARMRRTRSAVPLVAGCALLLLAWGAATGL